MSENFLKWIWLVPRALISILIHCTHYIATWNWILIMHFPSQSNELQSGSRFCHVNFNLLIQLMLFLPLSFNKQESIVCDHLRKSNLFSVFLIFIPLNAIEADKHLIIQNENRTDRIEYYNLLFLLKLLQVIVRFFFLFNSKIEATSESLRFKKHIASTASIESYIDNDK